MAIRVTKKCFLLSTLGVLVVAAALTVTLVLVLRDDEEISETYRFAASSIEVRLEEQSDHRYVLSIHRGKTTSAGDGCNYTPILALSGMQSVYFLFLASIV